MCFHCKMLNIYLRAAECRTYYTRYFATWFIPITFVSDFSGGKRPQHFFSNLTCVSGITVCFSERGNLHFKALHYLIKIIFQVFSSWW